MFKKGIVENNNDPSKLNRLQIRVIDKHTDNRTSKDSFEYLPTSDLPWAIPIITNGSSSINGECDIKIPQKGSVVACGYFDEDEQEMFWIGTLIVTCDTKPDYTKGFSDPDKVNPTLGYPLSDLLNGNDITNTLTTCPLFSEPNNNFSPEYVNHKVIQTKSGHFIEFDDTDGNERLRIYHKSGSFNETHATGDNVDKTNGDKYILADNLNIYAETNVNVYGTNVNVMATAMTATVTTLNVNSSIYNLISAIINETGNKVQLGDTLQTGNNVVTGTISGTVVADLLGTLGALRIAYNSHKHPETGTITGTTDTPA